MQYTSRAFNDILNSGEYESEVKVVVNGVTYYEDSLMDVSIRREVFGGNNVTIGSACMSSCNLTLTSDTLTGRDLSALIPRGARIEIWERITGYASNSQRNAVAGDAVVGIARIGIATEYEIITSEWLLQGVFFVDSRDATSWESRLILTGIDSMALADVMYPSTEDGWPEGGRPDTEVVQTIAQAMGVAIDSATELDNNYNIPFPGTYTMREVLGFIGAMYGGNWLITKEGKLQLLKLSSLPDETYYLVTNSGSPITFGGDRILVRQQQ